MGSDVYYWKPGRQARNGFVENGDYSGFRNTEHEVILGHPGEDVQEAAENKDLDLTGDTKDGNRHVSEQQRYKNRSRSYSLRTGPRMGSWVTSTFIRYFIVNTEL